MLEQSHGWEKFLLKIIQEESGVHKDSKLGHVALIERCKQFKKIIWYRDKIVTFEMNEFKGKKNMRLDTKEKWAPRDKFFFH